MEQIKAPESLTSAIGPSAPSVFEFVFTRPRLLNAMLISVPALQQLPDRCDDEPAGSYVRAVYPIETRHSGEGNPARGQGYGLISLRARVEV